MVWINIRALNQRELFKSEVVVMQFGIDGIEWIGCPELIRSRIELIRARDLVPSEVPKYAETL
jgi:hypothetical protein